jgi:RHS repeat-associated protein
LTFYSYNHKGDVQALLSESEDILVLYEYDAFGNLLTDASDVSNEFTFSTREFSEISGLGHWPVREYDPFIGRWIQIDPAGDVDGLNLYIFVRGNPITKTDMIGLASASFGEKACVCWALKSINKARQAAKLADEAGEAARGTNLPGARDGKQDAFRHCYWSCRLTCTLGADDAKKVTDCHEKHDATNTPLCRAMDEFNNAFGRYYGFLPGSSMLFPNGKTCNQACLDGVGNGDLRISPWGPHPGVEIGPVSF